MKRQESLISRYPLLYWAVVIVFLLTLGGPILRAMADVLDDPFAGCPAGQHLEGGDKVGGCEPD